MSRQLSRNPATATRTERREGTATARLGKEGAERFVPIRDCNRSESLSKKSGCWRPRKVLQLGFLPPRGVPFRSVSPRPWSFVVRMRDCRARSPAASRANRHVMRPGARLHLRRRENRPMRLQGAGGERVGSPRFATPLIPIHLNEGVNSFGARLKAQGRRGTLVYRTGIVVYC